MTGYAVLSAGETALLVDGLPGPEVLPLYRGLREVAGIVDLVPAESTLLVTFDPAILHRAAAVAAVESAWRARSAEIGGHSGEEIVIDVRYDGPDLEDAAALLHLTPAQLVDRHLETEWTAAFVGFAPGFAYLTADGDPLAVPRRATPRAAVPAGSVALGGRYCGVYPRESPGGWHLIGRTDATLWDAARPEPALLVPGARVRFRRA
jgi:5-oxoprolinase (ATP-hydrolysing) subunit B